MSNHVLEERNHHDRQVRLPNAAAEFEVRSFAYGSIAALLLAAALLSGCNTAKGIGDDVENAANKVEDAVD